MSWCYRDASKTEKLTSIWQAQNIFIKSLLLSLHGRHEILAFHVTHTHTQNTTKNVNENGNELVL